MNIKQKDNSDRFVIVDDNSTIIDDANGYGYKSREKAAKAMWYNFKGGKEKIEARNKKMSDYFKEHKGLKNFICDILMDNFKEIARGEVTNKDILESINEKFNIDMPEEFLENY